jgi:hypothetical protein
LATYTANKPPTSQVHKTLPGVPLDGAVVSGTPSLTGESPVEKSKVVSGVTAMARRGVHIKGCAFLEDDVGGMRSVPQIFFWITRLATLLPMLGSAKLVWHSWIWIPKSQHVSC